MSSVTDGWERPLRSIPLGDSRVVVYSVGPNELDERGAGDDLAIEVVLGSAVVTLPRGVVRVTGPLER